MSDFQNDIKIKSIRSYVSVDRFDRLSEKIYKTLQFMSAKKQSHFVKQILFHFFNNTIDKFEINQSDTYLQTEKVLRSIRVGVTINADDIGYGDLFQMLIAIEKQKERNVYISYTLFDALLAIHKLQDDVSLTAN